VAGWSIRRVSGILRYMQSLYSITYYTTIMYRCRHEEPIFIYYYIIRRGPGN